MEGEEAGKLRQGKDEIPIKVRLRAEDRANPSDLSRISLMSPKGRVALADIASLRRGEGPQVIEREARTRQIAIWATPNGRSLGDIVKDLKPKMDALELPPGVSFTYDGQIKQMNESNASMGLAMLLGVVFIYLVLASQFESFIHPLTIMLTLPLALVGAILGCAAGWLTNQLTGSPTPVDFVVGIGVLACLVVGAVTAHAGSPPDAAAAVKAPARGASPYQKRHRTATARPHRSMVEKAVHNRWKVPAYDAGSAPFAWM